MRDIHNQRAGGDMIHVFRRIVSLICMMYVWRSGDADGRRAASKQACHVQDSVPMDICIYIYIYQGK